MKRYAFVLIALALLALPQASSGLTRVEIPGGVYGEALPSGEHAVLVWGSHVQTHLGHVPLPDAERQAHGAGPLYLRLTTVNGFRFAGQSHAGLGTWEWRAGIGWTLHPQRACGVSPVIYDAQGVLRISDCSIGSQGWRYVDARGQLVTGDATYADIPNRIWEWTEHGGVRVGQGHDGCIALRGGDRRLIEPGDCRFVRFHRAGDRVAIVMAKFTEGRAVLLSGVVDELATFPVERLPGEGTIPPPPPPPRPPEPLRLPDDVYRTFAAVVAKFPHTGDDEARRAAMEKAVQTVRARHGLRYVWKTEHATLEAPSKDGMGYVPTGDVTHGRRTPMFIWDMVSGTTRQPNPPPLVSEPLREAYVLTPAPQDWLVDTSPPPPPLPPDDALLRARIRELEDTLRRVEDAASRTAIELQTARERMAHLEGDIDQALAERDQARRERDQARKERDELATRPEPRCEARVWGIKVPCRIVR